MATIGTFTRTADGFTGTIRTLTLDLKATIAEQVTDNDKAPAFRFYVGKVEFGAGWKKTSREDREYVSCKLDDPSFPNPIYASLVASEDGQTHSLIWSR